MTLLRSIQFRDSPNLGAFARLRVSDVFSLQIRNLSNTNEDYLGSLTWREIL